jgi:hypothetical protein
MVKFEVLVPGNIKIPKDYKKTVIRYNNCNVAPNRFFNSYFEDAKKLSEITNTDSIASEIYYQVFAGQLKKQQVFDTIIELKPFDFSEIITSDSLIYKQLENNVKNQAEPFSGVNTEVYNFSRFLKKHEDLDSNKYKILLLDPEFGLYTKKQIQQIAQSTGADLFFSLDFFAEVDGIFSPDYIRSDSVSIFNEYLYDSRIAREIVYTLACWNVYDLKKTEFARTLQKLDTIEWMEPVYSLKEAKRMLPPRKDAVLNAADIAGSRFADFISPHWIEVDRMYYPIGQPESKKTNKLVDENRWLEAAVIWKKNTTSKNKNVAAKSMFNMAVACEMNGEMDAAIDWAVKSFYLMGNKNDIHTFNCRDYINILARRKMDIQKIEN